MSDNEKMDRLMEQHAAAKARRTGNDPAPIKDLVNTWELDDRDAKLVCPQCGKARISKVPKSWWFLAEKRGEKNPFWRSPCDSCIELEGERKEKEKEATGVSEALELELPIEER